MTYNAAIRQDRLQGVILDWAGTTVDFGCIAPATAFVRLFDQFGMAITRDEARGPMGTAKRDHIAQVLYSPRVAAAWQAQHGRAPTDADVVAMYEQFIPQQTAALLDYADPIPGAVEAVAQLRAMGLKIGSNTGYTRSMMEALAPMVAARGYSPDALVVPEDVGTGRPAPFMAFEIARRLGIYPMWTILKVGDTPVDMEEARMAGMWAVGVAGTGNEIGLSERDFSELAHAERAALLRIAYDRLTAAGAHYVVDALADVPPLIAQINDRLAQGEKP
ncbi:MAG: phosphonoacetaldehyde hydrolase [bacterium]|nr:phosphonoacetaldehyde hydrolase [bacterium]